MRQDPWPQMSALLSRLQDLLDERGYDAVTITRAVELTLDRYGVRYGIDYGGA